MVVTRDATELPLTPAGDVQFDVPATTNKYLDLSSTYLTVEVSAHKADGLGLSRHECREYQHLAR